MAKSPKPSFPAPDLEYRQVEIAGLNKGRRGKHHESDSGNFSGTADAGAGFGDGHSARGSRRNRAGEPAFRRPSGRDNSWPGGRDPGGRK